MLPFLTTVAVAVAMMGMLNSLHRFFIPALSPAMFNVATILVRVRARAADAVVRPAADRRHRHRHAARRPRPDRDAVAGAAAEGFRYRPILDFRDPDVREILRLMGPGTLGLAAVQINVFVNTVAGDDAAHRARSRGCSYAFRLMYLPIGLFGVSIATAALPDISRHAAASDTAGDAPAPSRSGLRMMLMLNVPATIGLIVLAQPIVELLLERGSFTPHDTRRHGGGADVLRARACSATRP